MLIPQVTIDTTRVSAEQADTIRKLSVLGFVVAELPRDALDQYVSQTELDESTTAISTALFRSRTIVGPFSADMMASAISWLDNGARKVLVDSPSAEDSDLSQVATSISELPSNRVVMRLPVDLETLIAGENENAYALGIQDKILRLQDTIGGVIVQLRSSASARLEDEAATNAVATAVQVIRSAFDEGFLFAVEWEHAKHESFDRSIVVPRVASFHGKGIHVVAPALPVVTASDEQLRYIDAGRAFVKCIRTDRTDGLITTVVVDEAGVALGLVYSSEESILAAIESGRGVYYSRSRKGLWKKGESSGNVQQLVQLDLDCDSDALRFMVRQDGAGFCHLNTRTCWGESGGLQHLQGMLESRLREAPEGSYTKRLFNDPVLLRNKLVEEAQELAEAETTTHVAEEAADVMYFAMVRCVAAGATLTDVENQLDMRSLKVKRRPGNSKAYRIDAANEILKQQK